MRVALSLFEPLLRLVGDCRLKCLEPVCEIDSGMVVSLMGPRHRRREPA
jgi:hypothetical protein